MSWPIAFGGACLAIVIVWELVERARCKCPACGRRWFERVSMRCTQGFVDGRRVGGAFSEYRCKHCGAERVQLGNGPFLTRAELAALDTDPEALARFWAGVELPTATIVAPRDPRE